MNNTIPVRPAASTLLIIGSLLAVFLIVGASSVAADDRVKVVWKVDAGDTTYEVSSPSSAPLSAVKKRVMAEIGLVPGFSDNYEVHKSVVTSSTPVRDPNNPGQVIWIDAEEGQVLDESQSLAELGIASGETLKLVRVASGQTDLPQRAQARGR